MFINDYGVYSMTNTNYAHIAAITNFLVAWESDGCGPTFEYNTGCVNSDDCPWGNDFTKYITVDLAQVQVDITEFGMNHP